jgi:hypothetical protein
VTRPVVWIPEADADLKEALAWYEGIHPDLGVRFALRWMRQWRLWYEVPSPSRWCMRKYNGQA